MAQQLHEVLAISQSDYDEHIKMNMDNDTSLSFQHGSTVTDYTLLISSKYFREYVDEEETDNPLFIRVYNDNGLGNNCRDIVCGSVDVLVDGIFGDEYIVMPDEYFRKLQIEPFTMVKMEKIRDIKKINYIKIRGHDKNYVYWDGINEILEAHLNKFRAITTGHTTNVLGIDFTIMEMKDNDGNIITYGSLYETDVNIEFYVLEPTIPVKTTEEILKDSERVCIDEFGQTVKYNVDNVIESIKHKHFNWRLTF